jgi:hypothetical protein
MAGKRFRGEAEVGRTAEHATSVANDSKRALNELLHCLGIDLEGLYKICARLSDVSKPEAMPCLRDNSR